MRLTELVAGVPSARIVTGGDFDVRRVVQDSRQAGPGDLFVAVQGLRVDGHDFAPVAARQGAAVAVERDVPLPAGTPVIHVTDAPWSLGQLAAELHSRPGRRLQVVGVTGTDGKTTVTHAIAHILSAAGMPAGLMSTVAVDAGCGPEDNVTGMTTVDAPALQEALARMLAAGKRAAVIETTSHALVQQRVSGCEFDVAAFTYVGHDHLDYHQGWEAYLEAKAKLIDLCRESVPKGIPKTAIVNRDDASYERLSQRPIERRWSYSLEDEAELQAADLQLGPEGSRFRLRFGDQAAEVRLGLPARFNVANALCAAGASLAVGVPLDAVAAALSGFAGVPGRLEPIDLGQPFRVVVDFAHAAGALATTLGALRAITPGRLLTVFGSTPRSDHDRPGMGRAAARYSDWFVITTDDPTDGDPVVAAGEVEAGAIEAGSLGGRDYEVEPDRRAAIRRTIGLARAGDTVVIAGKGHETWMLMEGRRKVPWDDRVEAAAAIEARGWSAPNAAAHRTSPPVS